MYLNELLNVITSQTPQEIYFLNPWNKPQPLKLSNEEILVLVDFAIQHQPKIQINDDKKVEFLTLLMSMGTDFPSEKSDHFDPWIGRKDSRFENVIIERALAKMTLQNTQKSHITHGVFGLSGNPPTLNHLHYVQHLLTKYTQLHVILNAQSTLKDSKDYPPAETRLDMLGIMLRAENISSEHCILERLEIDRDPPSRMISTLSLLILKSSNQVNFVLSLGLDALFQFTRWYRWKDYAHLCEIKIYPRQGIFYEEEQLTHILQELLSEGLNITLVANSSKLKNQYQRVCNLIDSEKLQFTEESIPTFEGSATELRDYYAIREHDALPPNIHPCIDEYIRAHELYGYISKSNNYSIK